MTAEPLHISVPAGRRSGAIEALLDEPAGAARGVALVCHSMPGRGGSMTEPVIRAVAEAGVEAGIVSVRVSLKNPDWWTTRKSLARPIVRAAAQWLLAEKNRWGNALPVFGAGYSYGANALIHASKDIDAFTALALIGPPLSGKLGTRGHPLPWRAGMRTCIIAGENDQYCPPDVMRAARELSPETVEVESIPGADHYLKRHERRVANRLVTFLTRRTM